jgi:hypothetical protein
MLESEFWSRKVRPGLTTFGHLTRVENGLGSGMADVLYAIGGRQGVIELKVAKNRWIKFEPFQAPWLLAQSEHSGGKGVWVLVLQEREPHGIMTLFRASALNRVHLYPLPKDAGVRVNLDDIEDAFEAIAVTSWSGLANRLKLG